ncbi:4'-phosphopantetheinyl transferase [Martensiomyces pterosporus]|nr:4'-phosphopantetheinyl transferase [Martensiomyces pterosporus]
MILGIGVDILSIGRIEAVVRRGPGYTARFARRILCDRELCEFKDVVAKQGEAAQTKYLATRWCLKEAVYKAAYPHQTLRWNDVRVYKNGPKPAMHVDWRPEWQGVCTHASLSHDEGLVIGYVVVEKGSA